MFSSVDLHNNIRWHIAQVAVFITEASKRPRQKRGGFYKASYLFIASAVEAVVHDIVKKYCESNNVTRRQEFDYKHVVSLPNNLFLDSNANIGIYQKVAKPFIWDDKIEFNALNEIGRKYLLFDNRIFKKLDLFIKTPNSLVGSFYFYTIYCRINSFYQERLPKSGSHFSF
jgi:hypothetical protein